MIGNKATNPLKISFYSECWERQLTRQHADFDAQPNFLSSSQQTMGALPLFPITMATFPWAQKPLEVISESDLVSHSAIMASIIAFLSHT